MNAKKRIIIHMDMDHFYTAIEEREHLELKGKPIIVGADPKGGSGRGVVMTCNYEARKLGIKSGLPISKAWKISQDAIYLPPDFKLYVKVSEEVMTIVRNYGSKFEQWGIDEAFLDITPNVKNYAEAQETANRIKREILEKERLTCSIGIGPNKLIAKMASDVQKPDGLTVIRAEDVERFLVPLDVRKLLWVGKKTEKKLKTMGIKTIGDLARSDPNLLTEAFGVMGIQLCLMSHGIDDSEVEEREGVKSVSREITFEEDTGNLEVVFHALDKLSENVHSDVTGKKLCFRTVSVKVRYENFETHLRARTLPRNTNSLLDLEKMARQLLHEYFRPDRKIRLIGVRVSNLVSSEKQKALI